MDRTIYFALCFAALIVFITTVGFDLVNCHRCSLFINYYVIGIAATAVNLIDILAGVRKVTPSTFTGENRGGLFKVFGFSLLFSGVSIIGAFFTILNIDGHPFHSVSNVSLFGYSFVIFILSGSILHPLRFLALLVAGKM